MPIGLLYIDNVLRNSVHANGQFIFGATERLILRLFATCYIPSCFSYTQFYLYNRLLLYKHVAENQYCDRINSEIIINNCNSLIKK